MLFLNIIYYTAIIVVVVTAVAGYALFRIDKNAGDKEEIDIRP